MAKLPLDLSKFKYLSSDDKSTTLQHKDGHSITLAHKSLSDKYRKQLSDMVPKKKACGGMVKRMAQGGQVSEFDRMLADEGFGSTVGMSQDEIIRQEAFKRMSAGEDPALVGQDLGPKLQPQPVMSQDDMLREEAARRVAMGEDPILVGKELAPKMSPIAPHANDTTSVYEQAEQYGSQIKNQEDANQKQELLQQSQKRLSEVEAQEMSIKDQMAFDASKGIGAEGLKAKYGADLDKLAQQKSDILSTSGALAESAEQSQEEADTLPIDPNIDQSMALAPQQQIAAPLAPQLIAQQIDPTTQSLINAENAKATAAQKLANEQIKIEQEKQSQLQSVLKDYEAKKSEIDNNLKLIRQEVSNAQINPDKFWSGYKDPITGKQTGGHSKTMATIGMILGGFSPIEGPNGAIEYLKFQMDRDLEAQKQNLASKENLLNATLKEYGNLRDATDAAKLILMDDAKSRIAIAASKTSGELAKIEAQKAIANINQSQAKIADDLAKRSTLGNLKALADQDPSKIPLYTDALEMAGDEKLAKSIRGREVPGVGLARTEKDASELKALKGDVDAARSGIKELLSIANKPLKSLSPTEIARAQTIQGMLQGALRLPIVGPGAVSESEREMLQNIIANPTKIFSLDSSNRTRLKTLQAQLDEKFKQMASARGLTIKQRITPQQQQFIQWAQQTIKKDPKNIQAQKILRQFQDK